MGTSDRTFSFRAPSELSERMEGTRKALERIGRTSGREGGEATGWIARELEIGLLRRLAAVPEVRGQSAFMRAMIEALIEATERVEQELDAISSYGAFDELDREGEGVRAAMLRAAAAAME